MIGGGDPTGDGENETLLPLLDGTCAGQQLIEAFAGRVAADRMRSVLQDIAEFRFDVPVES